jgi:hypothetical protein
MKTNTCGRVQLHAILGGVGNMLSMAGAYCIYLNKERNGYQHLKSNHAKAGAAVLLSCMALGLVGGVVLHPDFGIDKTNTTIRYVHKMAGRGTLLLAWITAFMGLYQLIPNDTVMLAAYALPLMALVPFVLV